jgi:hypothetical protein
VVKYKNGNFELLPKAHKAQVGAAELGVRSGLDGALYTYRHFFWQRFHHGLPKKDILAGGAAFHPQPDIQFFFHGFAIQAAK